MGGLARGGRVAARGARGARRGAITPRGGSRSGRGAGGGARVVAGAGARARAGVARARPGLDPGLDRLDWRAPGSAGRASPTRGGSTGQARDRARRRRRRGARGDPTDDIDRERSSRGGRRAIEPANGGPPRSRSPHSRVSGRATNLILRAFARATGGKPRRGGICRKIHIARSGRTARAARPRGIRRGSARASRTFERSSARPLAPRVYSTRRRMCGTPRKTKETSEEIRSGGRAREKNLKRFGAPRADGSLAAPSGNILLSRERFSRSSCLGRLPTRRSLPLAPSAAVDHEDSHRVLLRRAPLG